MGFKVNEETSPSKIGYPMERKFGTVRRLNSGGEREDFCSGRET